MTESGLRDFSPATISRPPRSTERKIAHNEIEKALIADGLLPAGASAAFAATGKLAMLSSRSDPQKR